MPRFFLRNAIMFPNGRFLPLGPIIQLDTHGEMALIPIGPTAFATNKCVSLWYLRIRQSLTLVQASNVVLTQIENLRRYVMGTSSHDITSKLERLRWCKTPECSLCPCARARCLSLCLCNSAVHATNLAPFADMSGNALFMFLHVRCRGHLGRGRVRCQRRHLSIACDISSGRRTDVPAKCWGPCASKISKLDCSAHLAVVLNQFKTLCWTRTSRLGLNCSGDVATQAVLPWSSLMRAHGFRRNMPARRRSCVSRSGNLVG